MAPADFRGHFFAFEADLWGRLLTRFRLRPGNN
jgi:hypothetical protein